MESLMGITRLESGEAAASDRRPLVRRQARRLAFSCLRRCARSVTAAAAAAAWVRRLLVLHVGYSRDEAGDEGETRRHTQEKNAHEE